jgi:hypothetical protein
VVPGLHALEVAKRRLADLMDLIAQRCGFSHPGMRGIRERCNTAVNSQVEYRSRTSFVCPVAANRQLTVGLGRRRAMQTSMSGNNAGHATRPAFVFHKPLGLRLGLTSIWCPG